MIFLTSFGGRDNALDALRGYCVSREVCWVHGRWWQYGRVCPTIVVKSWYSIKDYRWWRFPLTCMTCVYIDICQSLLFANDWGRAIHPSIAIGLFILLISPVPFYHLQEPLFLPSHAPSNSVGARYVCPGATPLGCVPYCC